MIEQTQFNYHKPEQGEIGDCWKTCIACILHVDPYDIPHYYEKLWIDRDTIISRQVVAATNVWLKINCNIQYVEYPIQCTREELGNYLKCYYNDMFVIVGCNSIHGGHSVVMKNNNYMWDPSIDKSGCVGPMEDGYWWIGLLVTVEHVRSQLIRV